MKISIIGNGNLAQNLAVYFSEDNLFQIQEIYSRNYKEVQFFSQRVNARALKNISKLNIDIDILIIAITDRSIKDILKLIPKGNYLVLHTSGAVSIDIFKTFNFRNYGVIYPLYSFSKNRKINFKSIPLMIEASNNEALEKLKILSKNISEIVLELNSEERKQYHLSSVIVNNFSNHIWSMTQDLLKKQSLDFEYLKPILKQTCSNALEFDNLEDLQTGPAKRQDFNVIDTHLEILKENLSLKEIYKKMTESIIKKYENK